MQRVGDFLYQCYVRLNSTYTSLSPFRFGFDDFDGYGVLTFTSSIAEDKSLPAENSDRRRIFSVNQIIVDKSGTVVFPIRD